MTKDIITCYTFFQWFADLHKGKMLFLTNLVYSIGKKQVLYNLIFCRSEKYQTSFVRMQNNENVNQN